MRRIKFRGKGINTGEWVYGYFKRNRHGDCYMQDEDGLSTTVDSGSIGQFVCLDGDGVEVFEGDYLNYSSVWDDSELFLVKWSNEDHGFYLNSITEWSDQDGEIIDYCTVVGNIHDRSELPEKIHIVIDKNVYILGDKTVCKTPEEFIKAVLEDDEAKEYLKDSKADLSSEDVTIFYYLGGWALTIQPQGSVACWCVKV